jgi:hypothetical protein
MEFSSKHRKFVSKTFQHLSGVVKLAWKAVENIISNNRVNEDYFAEHQGWINPGLVVQMPHPCGAAEAFSTLITNNARLLESVIDKPMLLAFENLILQHGPHERLMSFFTAICSCLGSPILSNQETILSHLVMDSSANTKMLLKIEVDVSWEPPIPWRFNAPTEVSHTLHWHTSSDYTYPN